MATFIARCAADLGITVIIMRPSSPSTGRSMQRNAGWLMQLLVDIVHCACHFQSCTVAGECLGLAKLDGQ